MVQIRRQLVAISSPLVMGIVNVTPDSFACHCATISASDVLSECARLLDEGADLIDIGACSTRPGGEIISEQEEKRRLDIALEAIKTAYPNVIVSVDTFRSQLADYVLTQYGVDCINDVSGLCDEGMLSVLSRTRVPYIITYPGEPGAAMLAFFASRIDRLHKAGVTDVIVDPGLGFGKTLEQNYECIRQLPILRHLGCPMMIGLSRKSMIYNALGCTPYEALNGTTAAHMLALINGANILRVHDVKQAKESIQIWKKYSL